LVEINLLIIDKCTTSKRNTNKNFAGIFNINLLFDKNLSLAFLKALKKSCLENHQQTFLISLILHQWQLLFCGGTLAEAGLIIVLCCSKLLNFKILCCKYTSESIKNEINTKRLYQSGSL
jgi:hypothetical protein